MHDFTMDNVKVFIKADALLSILAPILEDYQNEIGGFIAGDIEKQWLEGRRETVVTVRSAYPSMTAERGKDEWIPFNKEAHKRALRAAKSLSLLILGGFHSHPYEEVYLSDYDKEYIADQHKIDIFSADNIACSWMELVISVKRKNYDKQKMEASTWAISKEGYRVKGWLALGMKYGFNISVGAFLYFEQDESFVEIPVYLENCTSYEKESI